MTRTVNGPGGSLTRAVRRLRADVDKLLRNPSGAVGVNNIKPATSFGRPTDDLFGDSLPPLGTPCWDLENVKVWFRHGDNDWRDAFGASE